MIEVLMLTQEDCAFCEQAQEIIQRLSADFDLQIRSIDIGSDRGAHLAAQGGILFAPGIFVEGQAFSYGRLSERRLRKHLDALGGRITTDA